MLTCIGDSLAVVFSRRRGNNRLLEEGAQSGNQTVASARAVVGWWRANRTAARRAAGWVPRSVSLSYESVVANPERACGDVMTIGFGSTQPSGEAILEHAVAGNRMLRGAWDGLIRPDVAWMVGLPRRWRILAAGVEFVARRAGVVPSDRRGRASVVG